MPQLIVSVPYKDAVDVEIAVEALTSLGVADVEHTKRDEDVLFEFCVQSNEEAKALKSKIVEWAKSNKISGMQYQNN